MRKDDLMHLRSSFLWIFSILPVGYIAIIAVRLITGHMEVVIPLTLSLLLTLLSLFLTIKSQVLNAVRLFVVSTLLVVTLICTTMNGIHDVGIIAYPVILLLAGLILRRGDQWAMIMLALVALLWLALGEGLGLYTPVRVGVATWAELIIMLVIMALSLLICYRVSRELHRALGSAEREVATRKQQSADLVDMVKEKELLTQTLHKQVSDSLKIIEEIMQHDGHNAVNHTLQHQISTIGAIHTELYRTGMEKYLDLMEYLEALNLDQARVNGNDRILVSVEQAMSAGLFLNEMYRQAQAEKLDVSAKETEEGIALVLMADKALPEPGMLADIMVRQVHGSLSWTDEGRCVTFVLPNPAKA